MKLKNWWFFNDDGVVVCYGNVEGSSSHRDGTLISTSQVIGVKSVSPLVIETKRSIYTLENPDFQHHKACIQDGCKCLGIRL